MGSSVFLGRQPRLRFKGVKPQRPPRNFFGTSCVRVHSMRKSNQILRGDQTTCEEKFCTVNNECWRAICLRQLTLLLLFLAEANVVVACESTGSCEVAVS